MAVVADALTALRLPLALVIAAVLGLGDGLVVAAAMLSLAWLSDFADGRLARRSGRTTTLAKWDPIADAVVGLGVLVGLVVGGRVSVFPWLVLCALVMAAFLATHNLALGMVVQAVAYGLFIVELAIDAPRALWMLGATAGFIGIADAKRLASVVLPTFFSGLGLGRPPRTDE